MADDSDYRAWVEVLPSFRNFNSQVQSTVIGSMAGAGTAGSAAMGTSLLAGVGKLAGPIVLAIGALGIGNGIADAIRSGVDAGIDYISGAVDKGSDYNESLNAISVSYGEFAAEIDRLSQTSATDLGLSRLDFNSIATQFSAFAKTIRQDNPAAFIDELSKRGADFASVYNLEVSDALRLFQSGIAGETEPLRRYGIDLSAATVQAYAWANGIAEQGTQLTEAQRQQAAYGALMEQTSITAGDFANTSDSLANSQRILQAQFADVQTELGMQLLPVLQEVLAFVSTELMPIWDEFNAVLGPQLKAALEEALPSLLDLAENVLPLVARTLPGVVTQIVYLINVFQTVAAQINIAAVALDSFIRLVSGEISFDEFTKRINGAVAGLAEMPSGFQEVIDAARTSGAALSDTWGEGVDDAVDETERLPVEGLRILNRAKPEFRTAGAALSGQIAAGIRSNQSAVADAMADVMAEAQAYLPHSPAKKGPFSGSGWLDVKQSGQAIMAQFESGLTPVDVPLGVASLGREMSGRLGLDMSQAEQQILNLLRNRRMQLDLDVRPNVGRRTL